MLESNSPSNTLLVKVGPRQATKFCKQKQRKQKANDGPYHCDYIARCIALLYLNYFQNFPKSSHGLLQHNNNTSPMSRYKTRRVDYQPTAKLRDAILNVRGHSSLETGHYQALRLQMVRYSLLLTIQSLYFSRSYTFLGMQCSKEAFDLVDLIRKLPHLKR